MLALRCLANHGLLAAIPLPNPPLILLRFDNTVPGLAPGDPASLRKGDRADKVGAGAPEETFAFALMLDVKPENDIERYREIDPGSLSWRAPVSSTVEFARRSFSSTDDEGAWRISVPRDVVKGESSAALLSSLSLNVSEEYAVARSDWPDAPVFDKNRNPLPDEILSGEEKLLVGN